MSAKSIRSCIEAYVSKYPENSGKQALLTRFDSVISKGINEFQAARDIILDEHKSIFKELNDVKARAGIAIGTYQRPGEANIAEVNNTFNEKKNKAISEVEKVHQEEMDKIEEKRKKKEAQRRQKAKEKEDKVKELEQKAKEKEQAKKEAEEKDKEEKQIKREPTKYQQDIKAITEQFGVYPNTNIPVPGFNEGTAEKIYRAMRRFHNPKLKQEAIGKIVYEARVAAQIKEKKSLSPNIEPKEKGGLSRGDVEAKKADIERRRQEELDKANKQIEKTDKKEDRRVKVETYRTLDIGGNPVEVEITTNADGSRLLRARQVNEDGSIEPMAYTTERINNKSQATLTNEKLVEGYIGNEDNTLERTNVDENPNQTHIDKINAKYDAELAELEKDKSLSPNIEPKGDGGLSMGENLLIGPHEYRGANSTEAASHYVKLMEEGKKPAAWIPVGDVQEKSLDEAAKKNDWYVSQKYVEGFGMGKLYATSEANMERLTKALNAIHMNGETVENSKELGRALGYKEEALNAWIKYNFGEDVEARVAGTGTSTLSNLPGEVQPTDADIMAVEGFQTILQATANWDGSPRKELNSSANRTIGEVRKELDNPLVEIKPEVIGMLDNKNEVDEGVDTNSHTYLFDLMTNAEASQDQRGVAASLIAAHRLSVGNTWLASAFRAAGKKLTVVFNDAPNSNIISATDRGNVTINAYKIGLRLDEFGAEKRFFSWLEMALYEEVFHLATFKVSNEEEVTQIGKELSDRERKVVESIYGEKLDDYGAGLEYVRQIMQHSLFGTATELLKAKAYGERSGSKIKEFFSKMLKFIKDIFETSKFPNEKLAKEVVKRIEDYLGITDPNERFKTPKQQLAEQPKLTLFEAPDDGKPVMQLSYKNRQYLMQERSLQSGKAIFEVERTPDGDFVPVNYGMNEVPGLLGANFSEAMQTIMRRGGRGVETGVSEEKIAGTSEEKSPKFDINSVFSQSLIDKAISYAKDFTKDGTGIERLPEEAEQGRRSSGPINAEATIITSRIIKAGEDAGRAAQERRSYAVEESFKWANKVIDLAGGNFGEALKSAINSGTDISKTKAVSQEHQDAINKYIRYSKEVDDLSKQIQILPHKIQQAQERALIQYATQSGLMVQDSDFSTPAHKHGTEAAIYLQKPTGFVTKLKKPDAMYGYWVNLFDSIALHNTLYPSTKYTIKGFYELPFYDDNVSDGNLRVVLQQQFFEDSGEDIKNAVQEDMRASGFEGDHEGPYKKGSVEVDDLHAENVWIVVNKETGEKVLIYIDPKVKWTGKVNEDYLDHREFGASEFKGSTPEITEEERRRLEAELAAEIVKQFGNTSAIKGDPLRDFVFPVDEDNKIMQDALMTMLKRDPYYEANTKDWERFPFAMQVAQNDMENLVGDLFANYEFDDVISYIIESLKDPTIELATRGQLAKVIMARIMYSHPDIVNVIREKIYPEIAKESAKTLLALKDQSEVDSRKKQPKKKKPKPGRNIVDVAELFSHDKQSQEMARILQSVEGGQEILDQMIDLNNRMRAHLVTTEEEETLGLMAEEADQERRRVMKQAERTKELVEHMGGKMAKFTEEEKKAAKTRADFIKYQMMTRRNLKSIEITFEKMKETINKIAKEC